MIAETANLTAGLKDVKEATVATNTRRESSKNGEKPRISFMFGWEQIANFGFLNPRPPEKQSRSNGFELLAESSPEGGAE